MPVFNALESVKKTLQAVVSNTDNLYEIIIVDDSSEEETRAFIDGLRIDDALEVRLVKTRNPRHSWTNASWNKGVALASGDYIAVMNSDIWVPRGWDSELISLLDGKHCSVACPLERKGDTSFAVDSLIAEVHPGMIKGALFMFRRQETKKFFPIPENLVHWCGDNYIADRAWEKGKGVTFAAGAIITHYITQSGRLIDPEIYKQTCYKDVIEYQTMSGRDMTKIIEQIMPSALQRDTESQGD